MPQALNIIFSALTTGFSMRFVPFIGTRSVSIKIHHGPNGSNKTSGARQDDAVPALKDGRVIITNIRGTLISYDD